MKKGWQRKQIGDLCEVIAGQSPEGKFYNADGKGMPFYQGKKDFGEKFIEAPTTWTTQTTKVAKEGDILMSVRAPVGPVNFATDEVCIGRGLAAIRSKAELNRDFLFYQLWHLQPEIAGREGAVFASINKAEIEALPLAFAPLPEQHRIVGLLDEAFDGIATAKANAKKNLQNARALFESHLQSVFTQRGKGWVEKALGDVCEVKDGTHDSPKYVADGIPFVTQKNIREEGLSFAKTKFISEEDHEDFYRRSNVAHGDILISMIGANRGMACVVDDDRTFSIKNVGLVKQNEAINQQFLLYFLKSPQAAGYVQAATKGGAQEFVGLTELRKFPVPVPPLKCQKTLADTFQALREETQHLESIYKRKLAALDELKKSLLDQAFTGAL
jgi:type I restriction enzyme S subunit